MHWHSRCLICLVLALLIGCNRSSNEIHTYQTPKQEDVLTSNPGSRPGMSLTTETNAPFAPFADRGMPATPPGPQRMLAAILTQTRATYWFIKVMDTPDNIAAIAEDFQTVVNSFDAADPQKPTWTTPEGWQEKPGDTFRYASLYKQLSETSTVGIAISRLDGKTSGEAQVSYVADNLNRWLGQVSRPKLDQDQVMQDVSFDGGKLSYRNENGQAVWKLDVLSPVEATTGEETTTSAKPQPDASPSLQMTTASARLDYTVPEGWTEIPATGMRKAAFKIAEADTSPVVTVIDLTAAAGELLPNINRWRKEVALEAITEAEISETTTKLTIQGEDATYIVLEGSQNDQPAAMLGIIWIHGSKSWFVKLVGPKELVLNQQQTFEQFAQSLTIK